MAGRSPVSSGFSRPSWFVGEDRFFVGGVRGFRLSSDSLCDDDDTTRNLLLNRLTIASILLLTACGSSSELGYSGISAPSMSVVPVDTEAELIAGIDFLQTASDITVLIEEKLAAAEERKRKRRERKRSRKGRK